MGKNEKNLKKKSFGFGFGKKKFCSDPDTEIGPWFRFLIPKPNFGLTLQSYNPESKKEISPGIQTIYKHIIKMKPLNPEL